VRPDLRDYFPAAVQVLIWEITDALVPVLEWFASFGAPSKDDANRAGRAV
jgi:hypothetical protein